MTIAPIAQTDSTTAAQRAIAAAETAAKEATKAVQEYAETLPPGYANGIVPHRAVTLAQEARDMANMSAMKMRRAATVANDTLTQQRNA